MFRKYQNYKLQTTPWHREEKPLNHHETSGRQIKQSNQLSLPHQDDCNTRMVNNNRTTALEPEPQAYFLHTRSDLHIPVPACGKNKNRTAARRTYAGHTSIGDVILMFI